MTLSFFPFRMGVQSKLLIWLLVWSGFSPCQRNIAGTSLSHHPDSDNGIEAGSLKESDDVMLTVQGKRWSLVTSAMLRGCMVFLTYWAYM